ncbi:MAG: TolB family protein, partial [Anaerolineales bacterium]
PARGSLRPIRREGNNRMVVITAFLIGLALLAALCGAIFLLALNALTDDENADTAPGATDQVALQTTANNTRGPNPNPSTDTPSTGGVAQPASPVNPDSAGREFAYAAPGASDSFDIFVRSTTDNSARAITNTPLNEVGPAFSPEGSQIAYYAYRGDGPGDIWLMNADGSSARNLTNSPGSDERVVSWSPDGQQLAYHSNADGDYDIYLYTLATNQTRNLTDSEWDDLAPSWSPDGARIAFHSDQIRGFNEIFVIDITGEDRAQVTDGNWQAAFAAWDPNGTRLAFHSILNNRYTLHLIRPNGEGFRNIALSTQNNSHAAWSSDGDAIIYTQNFPASPVIYWHDLQSNTTRRLVDGGIFPDWRP